MARPSWTLLLTSSSPRRRRSAVALRGRFDQGVVGAAPKAARVRDIQERSGELGFGLAARPFLVRTSDVAPPSSGLDPDPDPREEEMTDSDFFSTFRLRSSATELGEMTAEVDEALRRSRTWTREAAVRRGGSAERGVQEGAVARGRRI